MSNNNPTGKNGHPDCRKFFSLSYFPNKENLNVLASKDNEVTNTYISNYHRAGVTNRNTVSELLLAEHNISTSGKNQVGI